MSSQAKKVTKKILNQRITVVAQVLALMEEEANKKSFFQRFVICCQYLFAKKFDVFFKTKGKEK